jgi:hypothetical protein
MISLWSRLRKLVGLAPKTVPRGKGRRTRPRALGPGRFEQLEAREMLTVTYHGGALLNHVEAQPVFLGADWSSNAALSSQAGSLNQYVGYLVNSPYIDMLSQAGYNVSRGSAAAGQPLNLSLNKSTGINDTQIHANLQAAINSGQLAAPDANRLYVVYVEPGVAIKLGTDSSQNAFLGYHGAFAGKTAAGKAADIRYAVIAYPGSPNPSASSQGFANTTDDLTSVSSHEMAEAITDPDVNYKQLGWYDDQKNGEIGDLTSQTTRLNGYLVQDLVGKNDQVIAPATGLSGSGGTGGSGSSTGGNSPTTLAAPAHVAAIALTATTAQLSWTGVSGAAGYRVFLIENGQSTSLGSVSAGTSSVNITGLTAGAKEGFRVEAFSGSTVADSAVVSITMPAQPKLTPPQVTVTALSPTTAQLSWGAVPGAQGYRVYLWNGFRVVYLGTVGASTTSVQVYGLRAGSTSQLLVEAFGGGLVADSVWADLTTPASGTTSSAIFRRRAT